MYHIQSYYCQSDLSDYEEKGQSLFDCILEHYGEDAAILIGKLL